MKDQLSPIMSPLLQKLALAYSFLEFFYGYANT